MKLTAANVSAGFIGDAMTSNTSGRQALCKEFGISTLCQEKVTGGVLEFGTRKQMSAKPNLPLLPEKELKNSFDEFGAVYVIVWILRGDKWVPEANYTTPERLAYISATRTDDKTYCSECNALRLGPSSVVGFANTTKQTDVIYGADTNKQFTRRALAKEFNLQTIRFVPCQEGVVLESGTSERKTIGKTKSAFREEGGKGQTERGRLANLERLKAEAKSTPTGIFSPYVDLGKDLLGEDFVVEARKDWIQNHTDYIANGVKWTKQWWGAPLFSSFDSNGDGVMDREEFATYIEQMSGGERPTKDKVDKMMRNYDPDANGIELAEFMDASPTFVRKSLIKVASRNGKTWGLMV